MIKGGSNNNTISKLKLKLEEEEKQKKQTYCKDSTTCDINHCMKDPNDICVPKTEKRLCRHQETKEVCEEQECTWNETFGCLKKIPKLYVIFLMGPSSSGKTYGFDDVFLPQLRKDYPDLGTVYKIDGGIMRDASCFIQNKLEQTDIDDTERLKIYETYFKTPFITNPLNKKDIKQKMTAVPATTVAAAAQSLSFNDITNSYEA